MSLSTLWLSQPITYIPTEGGSTVSPQVITFHVGAPTPIRVTVLASNVLVESITVPPGAPIVTYGDTLWSLNRSFPLLSFGQTFIVTETSSTPIPASSRRQSSTAVSKTVSSDSSASTAPASVIGDAGGAILGAGAIAGIAIGGVCILLLILGACFFLRRKKKAKNTNLNEPMDRDSDKMPVDPKNPGQTNVATFTGYPELSGPSHMQELDPSRSRYPELSSTRPVQELDPSQAHVALYGAHELTGNVRPGEPQPHRYEQSVPRVPVVTNMVPAPVNMTGAVSDPSPNVQAQRRREVEWLEAEEARMRQRREQLIQQEGTRR